MLSTLTFFKAILSPGIIPLILTAIAAWIDFHFDTTTESARNKRKRAWWVFLVTGVIGTVASVMLFAGEQKAAEKSEAKATEFGDNLKTANDQLTALIQENTKLNSKLADIQADFDKSLDEILAKVSANPSAIANNPCDSTTASNSLANIHKVLVSLNNVGTTQNRATNAALQVKIENATKLLQLHSQFRTNAVLQPAPKAIQPAAPTGLRAVSPRQFP